MFSGDLRRSTPAGQRGASPARILLFRGDDWRQRVRGKRLPLLLLSLLIVSQAHAGLDTPHTTDSSIGCLSCHDMTSTAPKLLPAMGHAPQDIDDTLANNLCWCCHNDVAAPYVTTHSSLQIDDGYGNWTVECWVCHNQHTQEQFRSYGSAGFVYTGPSAAVTAATISVPGNPWTENLYAGYLVVPNTARPNYNYRISANTTNTLTVAGAINLTQVTAGDTLGIAYGKLIRKNINLAAIAPAKSGSKPVKFFAPTGTNSFADNDATYDGVCEVCHTQTDHFRNNGGGGDPLHGNMGFPARQDCTRCHTHKNGFRGMGGGAHTTHVSGEILSLACGECHNTAAFPQFSDGAATRDATTVCDNCHSANGVALAKQYWDFAGSSSRTAGSWAVVEGEKSFCGSCHDATPGNTRRDGSGNPAKNIVGDDATYGFYVTGHGRETGNYPLLSWQDSAATGNPAAGLQTCPGCHASGFVDPVFATPCGACHNLVSAHFNNPEKRIQSGMENDQANTNCRRCHSSDFSEGTAATEAPHFYTTAAAYEGSAHKDRLCTECHDIHGAAGNFSGMTKADRQNLCTQCHAGIGGHPGAGSTPFTHNGKNYTLQCVSCHNVHLVTGTYNQADQDKSPVTLFSDNLNVWGDTAGEKMDAYAGGGIYRTPAGESFSGAQLPDYASFCTDCHGQPGNPPFGLNWSGDPHGRGAANQPNGYGTCPNWFACGNAFGWDGDDCVGSEAECWPVMAKAAGDELYSREEYTHTDRVSGANFTLACTDCHTGHGTGNLGRPNVNGGAFTANWNSMCNNCHYYYSDWHAGMACGNASCHVSARMSTPGVGSGSTPHQMANASGSGGMRTHTPGLVLWYAFENNLKDAGGWELDGKWMDDLAGSYGAGRNGQAVVFGGGRNVQVGTENANWSTDEGYHRTWKYTEMKYNTTLEAWVYPTDSAANEYLIFSKHVGYSDGGYQFALRRIDNSLRVVFNMLADDNGFAQDGRSSARGAFSAVAIPLNTWTHVAATFDRAGPDRDLADPSVGRIRIYVNGEDVTTSKATGTDAQPGSGETSIFAYSENSPWNEAICYNGTWCASEFAIGGFYGWQNEFVGMLDEAKVWNITKDAAYFANLDAQVGPYISSAEGSPGSDQLTVTFSEGVYTDSGASGALAAGDFTFTDADNGRTITGVVHSPGSATALLTLSSPLDDTADFGVDTLAASVNQIFDDHAQPAAATAVVIATTAACPTGPVTFDLNEASGSAYVLDSQGLLSGKVSGGAATLTGSAYSGGGDGSGRYIDFENNDTCLQATTAMTLEVRLKAAGIPGDGSNYLRRILARDGGGNYQMSLWRNNATTDEDPPADVVMTALWVRPENAHGGNAWKAVLTDFSACPLVNDRWYRIRAVWDSAVVGAIPAAIFVDDQGVNGDDAGESWAGSVNCTDADQSQMPTVSEVWEGDVISPQDGDFVIGANVSDHINNLYNGMIDWLQWTDSAN